MLLVLSTHTVWSGFLGASRRAAADRMYNTLRFVYGTKLNLCTSVLKYYCEESESMTLYYAYLLKSTKKAIPTVKVF